MLSCEAQTREVAQHEADIGGGEADSEFVHTGDAALWDDDEIADAERWNEVQHQRDVRREG